MLYIVSILGAIAMTVLVLAILINRSVNRAIKSFKLKD